jgi:lysophospholipase L1-like esterase
MLSVRRLLITAGVCFCVVACGGGRTPLSPTPPPAGPPSVEPPPPPPATSTLGITRILAFGDSMTYGTTQPVYSPTLLTAGIPQSYPYKLGGLLSGSYTSQEIVTLNAGAPGESARNPDTRDRLGKVVAEAQPDVVLLMEGANDLNSPPPGGSVTATVDSTAAAMEDMVRDAVERYHVRVMLATLPPQRPGGSRAGAVTFLDKYNDALRQMAAKKGALLVDVNAQLPLSLIGQDGLHPTEAGYDRLAEIFRDAIVTAYDSTPAAVRR